MFQTHRNGHGKSYRKQKKPFLFWSHLCFSRLLQCRPLRNAIFSLGHFWDVKPCLFEQSTASMCRYAFRSIKSVIPASTLINIDFTGGDLCGEKRGHFGLANRCFRPLSHLSESRLSNRGTLALSAKTPRNESIPYANPSARSSSITDPLRYGPRRSRHDQTNRIRPPPALTTKRPTTKRAKPQLGREAR